MKFIVYKSTKVFFDRVAEILKKHEIQNNLLYMNINNGLSHEEDLDWVSSNMVMATVEDENGNILLSAIRTIPMPMVFYETENKRNDEAVDCFIEGLIKNDITIDYIFTEKDLAESFIEKYSKRINRNFNLDEKLVLYVLEKVKPLILPNGSFRIANNEDMYFLPYWLTDFTVYCKLGDWNIENGIFKTQKTIAAGNAYIWEDNTPVSFAASVRNVSNCVFIGNVYTPPHYRGKGYSTACVSSLTQKLLNDGWKYCALYADCTNPYSNKVYRSIGYKEVLYLEQYKLI